MTAGAFFMFAEPLLTAGYSPLPIIPGQKKPALRSWSNLCAEAMALPRIRSYGARWPRASLGIALGYAGVIALDVDTEDSDQLAAIREVVPPATVAKTGAKGFTAFYRAPPGAVVPSRHYADARKRGIADLLSLGTQTVLPPSAHPAGLAYRWLSQDTLLSVPVYELPLAPVDIAKRLDSALQPWMPKRRFLGAHIPRTCPPEKHDLRRLTAFAKAGLARRARALASTGEGGRNNSLFALGAGFGRYVFHGLLRLDALEKAALAACEANGLMREDGRLAVLATLHNGLARAEDDALPQLNEKRHAQCA
jgi:Bifunctional DNA primase/polymerase, N-terminal